MQPNYWAILAAAISSNLIGGLWYSPLLFGKSWLVCTGLTMESIDRGRAKKGYVIAFLCSLIRACVLSWLTAAVGVITLAAALKMGLWVSLGIAVATQIPQYYFPARPRRLLLIDGGQSIVSILAATVIVALWR